MFLYFGLLLFALACVLFLYANRKQKSGGFPNGRVISADSRNWRHLSEPLFDPDLELTGKPDYLVKQADNILPVEVKSNVIKDKPYFSHVIQLAAYCYLIETEFGIRPPVAFLHYPNRTFEIVYTQDLESQLLKNIVEIRKFDNLESAPRSHNSRARCAGCGYGQTCDQRLV